MILDIKGPDIEVEREAVALQKSTYGLTVADEEEYAACAQLLTEIRVETKALTAQRDSIVKPINEGLKRLRALYKPALDSLTASENAVKQAMLGFRSLQEKQRALAEQEAHEALAQGDHDEALAHIQVASQAPPTAAGISARKTWKLRVTDMAQVPRQFLVPDMALLRADAKLRNWGEPPAGVEYYQDESLAVLG
jgi:hypothetical protein